nr:MAG TPA: hypothetical protein [Caudoviricetes sp.]
MNLEGNSCQVRCNLLPIPSFWRRSGNIELS